MVARRRFRSNKKKLTWLGCFHDAFGRTGKKFQKTSKTLPKRFRSHLKKRPNKKKLARRTFQRSAGAMPISRHDCAKSGEKEKKDVGKPAAPMNMSVSSQFPVLSDRSMSRPQTIVSTSVRPSLWRIQRNDFVGSVCEEDPSIAGRRSQLDEIYIPLAGKRASHGLRGF